MTNFESVIKKQLKELFPHAGLKEQYHIKKKGMDLYFDFYLPHINLLIECQGEQHYKFISHFHADKKDFQSYQYRDELKKEWAEENEKLLLEIKYDDIPSNKSNLFWKINKVIEHARKGTS